MTPQAPCICVVEDDEGFRRSLGRLLKAHHFSVLLFESAREFLANMPANACGCLVLDVSMPGMNGLDLQQKLLEMDCGMPIVFLTGRGDIPMCARAMKQGAADFLIKPVDEALLLHAVRNALAENSRDREIQLQTAAIRQRIATLTPREVDVLRHVIAGKLNKQIGGALGIAEKTVKAHRGRMMRKMGVPSVAELVRGCSAAGLDPLSGDPRM
jgi:FixJ family two-component response regulator